MKTDPRYGYYDRWPEDGERWIHPEDLEVVRRMIPSQRIWRRDGVSGPCVVLHYGPLRVRVRPTLWNEVESEGIEVGDWVEVLSRMQLNWPHIGTVREMLWDSQTQSIQYQLERRGQPDPHLYARADLRPVQPLSPTPA